MQTILNALREILGTPDFYKVLPGSYNNSYSWDYAAMIEYLVAALLLLIVVSSVFKLLFRFFGGGK